MPILPSFAPFVTLYFVKGKEVWPIVHRIVAKFGGQAGVESEGAPGQGSTLYFTRLGVPAAALPASGAFS